MIENGGVHDLYRVPLVMWPTEHVHCMSTHMFFVYLLINKALLDHIVFCLHFTFHLGFLFPTNQKLPTEYSAHGSNGCLVYSQMMFFSQLKTFEQATSIYGKLLLCTSIVSIASTAD